MNLSLRSAEFGPESRLLVDGRLPWDNHLVVLTAVLGSSAVEFRLQDDDLLRLVWTLVKSADETQFKQIQAMVEQEAAVDRT